MEEAWNELLQCGNLNRCFLRKAPYSVYLLSFPLCVDISDLVSVLEEVITMFHTARMDNDRINQLTSIKNAIRHCQRHDETWLDVRLWPCKEGVATWVECCLYEFVRSDTMNYSVYTRNVDFVMGALNAMLHKSKWPISCSAAMMVLKHWSWDSGKLGCEALLKLHESAWLTPNLWASFRAQGANAIFQWTETVSFHYCNEITILRAPPDESPVSAKSVHTSISKSTASSHLALKNTIKFKKHGVKPSAPSQMTHYFRKLRK